MFRPRIIPVLLLRGAGLVKTVRFSHPNYIGDPINAVRLFNDMGADELVFLDIVATQQGRTIDKGLVKKIGDEAFMPFSVGGGIVSVDQVRELLALGAEKVVINSAVPGNMTLIETAAKAFGSQSIIISVDVHKKLFGSYEILTNSGKKRENDTLKEYIKKAETAGAGEILINSIDRDGMMTGYDLELIREVSSSVRIPVIACGGAGSLADMRKAYYLGGASACAAGSLFVYHGARKGILINYPEKPEIKKLFSNDF